MTRGTRRGRWREVSPALVSRSEDGEATRPTWIGSRGSAATAREGRRHESRTHLLGVEPVHVFEGGHGRSRSARIRVSCAPCAVGDLRGPGRVRRRGGPSEEGLGHADVARIASPCLRRAVKRSACVARASKRWSPRRLGSREMRRRLRCCALGRLHPGGQEAGTHPCRSPGVETARWQDCGEIGGTRRDHGAHTKSI